MNQTLDTQTAPEAGNSTTSFSLTGTRFGVIQYESLDIVRFDDGLIGFPNCRQFVLISAKPDSPFRWLQSVEQPALAFLVVDPIVFVPEYSPSISNAIAGALKLTEDTPQMLFTTVTIPSGQPDQMTLNLAGPIVVNAESRIGKQVVLEDEAYTTKHRVFQKGRTANKTAA